MSDKQADLLLRLIEACSSLGYLTRLYPRISVSAEMPDEPYSSNAQSAFRAATQVAHYTGELIKEFGSDRASRDLIPQLRK